MLNVARDRARAGGLRSIEEVAGLLEADGSQVMLVDQHGRTPLDAATRHDSVRAAEPPHTEAHDLFR
jgi:hypothetical protein